MYSWEDENSSPIEDILGFYRSNHDEIDMVVEISPSTKAKLEKILKIWNESQNTEN